VPDPLSCGYHNTFEDAAVTMGELCHFFASEHLRKTIRTIAQTPGLERIHLLAHSRGTDVLVTALSDLNMEAYTQHSDLAQRYKIGNVVLMAPDIDADVAIAKVFNVRSDPDVPYGPAPAPRMVFEQTPGFRLTIYVSPDDKALAASSWLFGSLARLGRLDTSMLTPGQIEQVRRLGTVDVIRSAAGPTSLATATSLPSPR
jgi:esterase/lipase superfamily enzyme